MEGVVLQTYGHGNWPTILSDMMAMIRQACDDGLIIINTTQCTRGSVSPIYAVGKQLQVRIYLRQGGYVFAGVCLFVCLSVCLSVY